MPVNRLKMLAIAVGAGVAGLVGAVNGAYYQGVFPTSFDFPLLITIYTMVILGGAGSLAGSSSGRSSSTSFSRCCVRRTMRAWSSTV